MNDHYKSEAEWYCKQDPEEKRFYNIFFRFCRKYSVNWASATDKEKAFIEEITRVTYERDKALRIGTPVSEIRPAFVPKYAELSERKSMK